MKKTPDYLIAVGASAGGLNSLLELAAQLKEDMNAAVVVVLHLTKISTVDGLLGRLQGLTPFTCSLATDEAPLQRGHLYLAQPDAHLLVEGDRLRLGYGAAESRWRPSIDVLFRSAALAFNSRTIAITLSGLLQDGTAGMLAVKRCGGTLIIQSPEEAEYPDMPLSVLRNMEVDYSLPLDKMGNVIEEKLGGKLPPPYPVPEELAMEGRIASEVAIGIDRVAAIGRQSLFSCPDCGGGLWEVAGGSEVRYRCHVGHAYTEGDLLLGIDKSLESTLWVALRMMEERRMLLEKMAGEEGGKGWAISAQTRRVRAEEMRAHIQRLKELLFANAGRAALD